MKNSNASVAWVEYYQVGESRPTKMELRELPIVIGRDDSADFTVDSNRVSREHAMLDRQGDAYVLRDLESTNGTHVNGQRITETILSAGDVIVIADFELTFHSGSSDKPVSVTQVMTQPVSGSSTDGNDLIIQVRRLHEALTHRSINACFQPIMELGDRSVFGYEVTRRLDDLPGQDRKAESVVEGMECRLTDRINQQHRLFAVEQAKEFPEALHLFLGLQVSELSAAFLPESLDRLVDIVHKHRLVAEIPESAVCDIPYFRQFIQTLRDRDIRIAYTDFRGALAQISSWRDVVPDFVKLSPSLVRGVSRASGGSQTVRAVIQAIRELGSTGIATGLDNCADVQCLTELDCQFGQGDFLGAPEPISAFVGVALVGAGH